MSTSVKLPKVKFYSKATWVLTHDKAPISSVYDLFPEYDITKEEVDEWVKNREKAQAISAAAVGSQGDRDMIFNKIDEKFIEEYPHIVVYHRGENTVFHTYKNGAYVPLLDREMYNLIDQLMAKYQLFEHRTSKRKVEDTRHRIISLLSSIKGRHFSDAELAGRKWYLNLKNGLLDMETFELSEHTPEYFSVGQVPYEYDPGAQAPEFKKFLTTITRDSDSTIRMIQEMFGYCIRDGNAKHKVFYLYGETARNGKSTTAKILCGLIGWANVSTLTLAQLASDRTSTLTSLINKQVNFADEISSKFIDSSRFTSMSAEGVVEIDPKFKTAFLYKVTAKFVIACNDLPRFQDSQGMKHRMISIPFRYQIPESERIDRYEDLLLEKEASGILNWAIEGAKRFASDGKFTINEESSEDMHMNALENNSTYAFLESQYDFSEEHTEKLSAEELYGAPSRGEDRGFGFRKFCDDAGLPSPSIHTFRRELSRFSEETGNIKQIREDNRRFYVGLIGRPFDL